MVMVTIASGYYIMVMVTRPLCTAALLRSQICVMMTAVQCCTPRPPGLEVLTPTEAVTREAWPGQMGHCTQ